MKQFILGLVTVVLMTGSVWAANCYVCGAGSSDSCKNYCQYTGADDFKARKRCQDAGCKVGGTATCPTAANYKICFVGGLEQQPSKNLAQTTPNK